MIRIVCIIVAVLYLWLYPSLFLVPAELREGYWSAQDNIEQRGLVVSKEICVIDALFIDHTVYRVGMLINGKTEYFWVASAAIYNALKGGELTVFERRGKVIVLKKETIAPLNFTLLNN